MDLSFKNVTLEEGLARLAATLTATEAAVLEKAKQGSQTILKMLRKAGQDVDRAVIVGSLVNTLEDCNGNRGATSTNGNFDVVIFINNREPPFQSTLRELAEIFSKSENIKIVNTEHSQFIGVVFSGFRYDIFPANNCIVGQDKKKQQHSQYQKTVEKIIRSESPAQAGRMCSPALAEAAVEFTRKQSESDVVRSVITLAKYWMSQINTEGYCLLRRSYLVECIAIYAVIAMSNNGSMSDKITQAFKRFLELITNFNTLKINLSKAQIPDYYQSRRYAGPLVIDPVNPYNNLAILQSDPTKQDGIVQLFQSAAMVSLWKFHSLQSKNIRIKGIKDISTIFVQFESLSTSLSSTPPARRSSFLGWIFFTLLLAFIILWKGPQYMFQKFGWYAVGMVVFLFIYFANRFFLSK